MQHSCVPWKLCFSSYRGLLTQKQIIFAEEHRFLDSVWVLAQHKTWSLKSNLCDPCCFHMKAVTLPTLSFPKMDPWFPLTLSSLLGKSPLTSPSLAGTGNVSFLLPRPLKKIQRTRETAGKVLILGLIILTTLIVPFPSLPLVMEFGLQAVGARWEQSFSNSAKELFRGWRGNAT